MRAVARRAVVSAASTVLVGIFATTGCGRAAHAGDGSGESEHAARDKAAYTAVGQLPERLAPDGTTVVVGSPAARTTVRLYEDMRCPVCEEYEVEGGGAALRTLALSGEVKTEYTLASFLDDRVGGGGSKRAANALRAALEQGKFIEYHDVLFANQPEEVVDGYTDAFLLDMASRVKVLRGTEFDRAVRTMKYRAFVSASQAAYERDGALGTPTFAVNGDVVPDHLRGAMFEENLLPVAVEMLASGVTPPPEGV
ncbi:thioredoxin domain-containing protein [Streptomyces sp. NPDC046939]|uniref:DsbA family protein n=1 Tax=Streptomyces sp. NPDC046939 TaxID=3155376 RepID=UPI0033E616A5